MLPLLEKGLLPKGHENHWNLLLQKLSVMSKPKLDALLHFAIGGEGSLYVSFDLQSIAKSTAKLKIKDHLQYLHSCIYL